MPWFSRRQHEPDRPEEQLPWGRQDGASRLAARLPEPAVLRRWCLGLAALDVVMSPDPEFRYFSYDPTWGPGEQLASMNNGSGDEFSVCFTPAGVLVRGFDHESPLSPYASSPTAPWPGLLEAVPGPLREAASEPAFTLDGVPVATVVLWRLAGDDAWSYARVRYPAAWDDENPDVDGASWLFEQLDGDPAAYVVHAEEYWERTVPAEAVAGFLRQEPATATTVQNLEPDCDPERALRELAEIGYPVADLRGS
jgi:hypothetical protein